MMEANSDSDELGELDEDDFGDGLFESSHNHLEDADENASNEEDGGGRGGVCGCE